MAVKFPQTGLPIIDGLFPLSGGSDKWDDGLAGQILSQDYFASAPRVEVSWAEVEVPAAAPAGTAGQIKVWSGSAWVFKPVKVWTGTAWVSKPVKRWNGTAWV